MKVALLADIHGNADALEAVLADAKRECAEQLLIAGDFVGYYYAVARVMALLDAWQWTGVRGNHEDMLAAWRRGQDRSTILQRYGSALEVTSGSLDAGRLEALESLPHPRLTEVDGKRVRLCHGSPWDIDCYVYPDAADDIRRRVTAAAQDVDLMLLGHTHHPMVWTEGRTMIVNPGSVGQPRDRKPGAAWALWDTAAHEVTLRRTAYDPAPTIEECRRRDPDLNYLVNVLVRTS